MDYNIMFNNQSEEERKATKILLNLPMIPKSRIGQVQLRHLDHDHEDESHFHHLDVRPGER
jgi:hypothetical protein